jgi:hypothetical protein
MNNQSKLNSQNPTGMTLKRRFINLKKSMIQMTVNMLKDLQITIKLMKKMITINLRKKMKMRRMKFQQHHLNK